MWTAALAKDTSPDAKVKRNQAAVNQLTSTLTLVSTYVAMGEHSLALPPIQEALSVAREHFTTPQDFNFLTRAIQALALAWEKLGQLSKALPLLKEAMNLGRQAVKDDASLLNKFSTLYLAKIFNVMGEFDKALSSYKRVMSLYDDEPGGRGLLFTTGILEESAAVYMKVGQYHEAIEVSHELLVELQERKRARQELHL